MKNHEDISSEFSVATINALSAHIAILDDTGVIINVNQAWSDFAKDNGAPEEVYNSFKGTNYFNVCNNSNPEEQSEAYMGIKAVMQGHIPLFTLEYPCHSPTEERWFILRVTRFNANNKLYIVVAHENITHRKLAENKSNQLLKEKEVILKEVHHRIKNNIANIEGLLFLQMMNTENEEVKSSLQEAINRVKSMGLLYEQFMSSEEYEYSSVKLYVHNLLELFEPLWPSNTKVLVNTLIDDFLLCQKKLMILGIIINELLTNISKYAFHNISLGQIDISLLLDDNDDITLEIKDNGIGLKTNVNSGDSTNIGSMLIKMLAQQIGGFITIKDENGVKSILKFNAAKEVVRTPLREQIV